MSKNVLAYYGGKKAIKYLMPRRKSVDTFEVKALNNLITYNARNAVLYNTINKILKT